MDTVIRLEEADNKELYGGKATNLAKLFKAGLPVPPGFAVSIKTFGKGRLNSESAAELEKLIDKSKLYAVRSSGINEDAEGASWAGQFDTFLNVNPADVIQSIEKCHSSARSRAKSYATEMEDQTSGFEIAVVVQEMLDPEYAGVLFTQNPVTGMDEFVIEYVEGVGEALVSGKADPVQIVTKDGHGQKAPFDLDKLVELAQLTEKAFESPQDIEWAWQNGKIWLLQARPITTLANYDSTFNLGEPADLFYWGPSRTEPLYMSDYMVALGKVFSEQYANKNWPNPPKTIALFHDHQVVFLINSNAFNEWVEKSFEAYLEIGNLADEVSAWEEAVSELDVEANKKNEVFAELVAAFSKTVNAEFSLYGAEVVISKMLNRLTDKQRQEVWQAFTLPDQPGFLQQIDNEILAGTKTKLLAEKYPWIQDGYFGVVGKAEKYFDKRRTEISDDIKSQVGDETIRNELATRLGLSPQEVTALSLARGLAKFMDDRKAWMMKTRSYLSKLAKNLGPNDGWLYDNGNVNTFDKKQTGRLWNRYIDHKVTKGNLKGTVASNAGEDMIEGEVFVIDSPNSNVPAKKILIVPSTSPSYVPLMRNARALITNHGGMMSHAAIVAREFGLPCIVGTKTATKQLKSGDQVVMDLVTGAIQVITI